MSWITTVGPFWSDNQQHCSNDHIFINNQNIIESALAEAGYHCFLGEKIPAVSFACTMLDKNKSVILTFSIPETWLSLQDDAGTVSAPMRP